jgi:hypothetical protein
MAGIVWVKELVSAWLECVLDKKLVSAWLECVMVKMFVFVMVKKLVSAWLLCEVVKKLVPQLCYGRKGCFCMAGFFWLKS